MKSSVPSPDFLPIQCVCTNLKMAGRAVARSYDAALAPHGINVIQYSILVNIARYQPVPQIRLADHLEMERTTLYRALAVLDKQGLLSLSAGARGPSKTVSLTEAGESLVEAARKTWSQLHEAYLHRFGEDGLEQLNSFLAEVRDFSHHIFTRS